MDDNFVLNPNIQQTAAGSITGDIDQLQNAVYGREVRASIAEALYLLNKAIAANENKCENGLQQLLTRIEQYQQTLRTLEQQTLLIRGRLGMLEFTYPDVDGDGEVTAADPQLLLEFSTRISAGDFSEYGSPEEKWNAFAEEKGLENSRYIGDVNGDGKLDATDSASVLGYASEAGAGNYPNNEDGFREYMLDSWNAIFGSDISGIRAISSERYEQIEKKDNILYAVFD